MGVKAADAIAIPFDDFEMYLRAKHSVYMEIEGKLYYITDANERYWRVQDTEVFNEKGHYTDCSELAPTVREFLALPFRDGKCINDLYETATFYPSEKPE